MKTIALKLIGDQWYARCSPDGKRLLTLYGEQLDWIPTGFTGKATPTEVVTAIKSNHPEAAVGLAGKNPGIQPEMI
jgi:hypothetical protein